MAASATADGKRSLFRRGLNATRLALALVVTVAIVTIVVYAVVVVSRKEQLALWVAGSIIYVRPQRDPTLLGLTFTVKANNPSGRVRFYYTNIEARLLLKNGTNSTDILTFARFPLGNDDDPNMDVAPVSLLQVDAHPTVDSTERNSTQFSTYFNKLRNDNSSSIISDAMLKLNGTLTVGLYSVHNKTSEQTIYYCYPLTIGAASNASADVAQEQQCQTDDPWK